MVRLDRTGVVHVKVAFSKLLVARLVASVANALSFILLARETDVTQVGYVAATLGVATVAAVAIDAGMSTFLPKMYAMDRFQVVRVGLRWNFVGACVLVAVASIAESSLGSLGLTQGVVTLLVAGVAIDKYVDTRSGVLIAAKRINRVASVTIGRKVLAVALFPTLLWLGLAPELSYSLALILGAAAVVPAVLRALGPMVDRRPSEGSPLVTTWEVLREARYFWLSNLTSNLRLLDVPVVSFVGGASIAGIYSVAARTVQPFTLVSSSLSSLLIPRASISSPRESYQLARRLAVLALLAIPCTALASLAIGPMMQAVFGPRYEGSIAVMTVLVLAIPLYALAGPIGSIAQGQGLDRAVAIVSLTVGLLNLVATVVAVQYVGAVGAAWALFAASAVRCAILLGALACHARGAKG